MLIIAAAICGVFLISGGARGLGEAQARQLVAEGGKVLIGDILADEVDPSTFYRYDVPGESLAYGVPGLSLRHDLQAAARHRALADAQLIFQFWQKIHVDRSSDEIESALKSQNAHPSLPPHLDADIVDALPEAPGVYLFYGENNLPLYVGKAKDIRQRVLSHFAGDHSAAKEMELAQQVRRIDWIETAGEIGALLKESTLVKSLQPSHNRQLRKNDEACTWTLRDEGDGWLRPQLVSLTDIAAGNTIACYGLFKSGKEANNVLRTLADSHHLCDVLLGLEKVKPGKPCFGHQLRRCKGACVGNEPYAKHTVRLISALVGLKLVSWPFTGPAVIREGDEAHVIDRWRYLGTATTDDDLNALLDGRCPPFDRDTYKILAKNIARMTPLPNRAIVIESH